MIIMIVVAVVIFVYSITTTKKTTITIVITIIITRTKEIIPFPELTFFAIYRFSWIDDKKGDSTIQSILNDSEELLAKRLDKKITKTESALRIIRTYSCG